MQAKWQRLDIHFSLQVTPESARKPNSFRNLRLLHNINHKAIGCFDIFMSSLIIQKLAIRVTNPCAGSWMNRPIPSWLLHLWQKESVQNLNVCHIYSLSWKSSYFHVKRLAQALDLKNSEVEVSQVAHQAGTFPGFCIGFWSDKKYFYYPLNRMLVHRWITPNIKLATCEWEWSVLPKKKTSTMFPARART